MERPENILALERIKELMDMIAIYGWSKDVGDREAFIKYINEKVTPNDLERINNYCAPYLFTREELIKGTDEKWAE